MIVNAHTARWIRKSVYVMRPAITPNTGDNIGLPRHSAAISIGYNYKSKLYKYL